MCSDRELKDSKISERQKDIQKYLKIDKPLEIEIPIIALFGFYNHILEFA